MRKYLILFFLPSLFFSCSNRSGKEGATISGNIKGVMASKIYLEQFVNATPQPFDSTTIDKEGNFYFTGKVDAIAFFRIKIADDKFISLVVDTDSKIQITADANKVDNYTIIGSEDSKLLKDINHHLAKSFHQIDSLSLLYQAVKDKGVAIQDSVAKTLQVPYNKIIAECREESRTTRREWDAYNGNKNCQETQHPPALFFWTGFFYIENKLQNIKNERWKVFIFYGYK